MTKKIFVFGLLFIFFEKGYFFAQNLVISDSMGNNLNGQTIYVTGSTQDSLLKRHFGVKNTFSDTLEVKMTRTEIGKGAGTQNYFCWSICYGAVNSGVKPTWTDFGSIFMKPDSVYENLSVYFVPNGKTGLAGFHYVLFDVANPGDSAFVDIYFDITTGIGEEEIQKNNFEIFPNPSFGKIIFNNVGDDINKIEIRNIPGEIIFQSPGIISGKEYTFEFPEGVYFVSFLNNEKLILTKRMVIGGQ